uniref:Uncharacterized protein n=1 Tax=Triticum urartu TaxID=4572 RepID=A0A8R7Q2M8_TRIUA
MALAHCLKKKMRVGKKKKKMMMMRWRRVVVGTSSLVRIFTHMATLLLHHCVDPSHALLNLCLH